MLQDEMVPAADRAKGWDVVGYQDHISDEEGHFPYLWPGDLVLLEQCVLLLAHSALGAAKC